MDTDLVVCKNAGGSLAPPAFSIRLALPRR